MRSKVIIGKPTSQLNDPWYKRPNGATDINIIEKHLKGKIATASYFKIFSRNRGGVSNGWKFYKTLMNGYMICVDEHKAGIFMVAGISLPHVIEASTRIEYQKHFNRLIKILST